LFVGVVLAVGFVLPAPGSDTPRGLLSYDQFISISLTAVTVVLAVIALLMAYLAFEGKNQIVDRAREVAEQEFQKLKPQLMEELKSDAKSQVMDYVAQEHDLFFGTKSATTISETSDLPIDIEELKNE
jgi:hypothetical protein